MHALVLLPEYALIWMVVQKNGAPAWIVRAADCEKNVLQWLSDKGIKSTAVDSYVSRMGDLGIFLVR